ncbi:hypothetical protein QUA54_04895 [Microcoleus sp. MOSTC5]
MLSAITVVAPRGRSPPQPSRQKIHCLLETALFAQGDRPECG